MQFDTDVLIWLLRGNAKAAAIVDATEDRHVSVVSYMELLQGARDAREARTIRQLLIDSGFRMLPLTENIGHRAVVYLEGHAVSSGLRLADALLTATAVENGLALCTGNDRHYRVIPDLPLRAFRP